MDELLTIAYRLLRYLPDVCMHFLSSALAALLGWYWTWTISWLLWGITCGRGGRPSPCTSWSRTCAAGRCIRRLSWSAALFCSLALHVTQDYWCWLW